MIEKSRFFGGSTARSGGGAWVPNAPALLREGQRDDPAQIVAYLERDRRRPRRRASGSSATSTRRRG